jgi:fructokinase
LKIPPGEIDLLAVGEILVDFISTEPSKTLLGVSEYKRCFGGAPANVAVNIAQLGGRSAVIGKVGDDAFGSFLVETLNTHGVITDGVLMDPNRRTSLIFIARTEPPAFEAHRDADFYLMPEEIKEDLIARSRIVHTSAFALSLEPSRSAVIKAIRLAKEMGKLVSFEPNYRPSIWPSFDEAMEVLRRTFKSVDMVKPSLDDAKALFGEGSPEEYVEAFRELGPSLVVLTMGGEGCLVYEGREMTRVATCKVEAVDTTGAGDAFWAGFTMSLIKGEEVIEAVRFGNALAAFKSTHIGAISTEVTCGFGRIFQPKSLESQTE